MCDGQQGALLTNDYTKLQAHNIISARRTRKAYSIEYQ